jgi:hypothetical protein
MPRFKGKISENPISQENHTTGDAIPLSGDVVKITVKNMLTGTGNITIGWGGPGGGNVLIPGESATYFADDIDLEENDLYITFQSAGGKALVSTITRGEQKC